MLKKYLNNPAHLFIDNSPYFITAAIYQKRNLLHSSIIKDYLLTTIQKCFDEIGATELQNDLTRVRIKKRKVDDYSNEDKLTQILHQ